MKILGISLLRIGDLIMHQSLINQIKLLYPNAEIHLLINDVCLSATQAITGVDSYWVMPRQKIQTHLVQSELNPHVAFKELNELSNKLSNLEFDAVYNFTHNSLSARLIDLIKCDKKIGVHFEQGQFRKINNRWLTYFNENFSSTRAPQFHYLENLARSLDFETPMVGVRQKIQNQVFAIQPLTSDTKKNWPVENWVQFLANVRDQMPESNWYVLGSPSEKPLLEKHFSKSDLKILSFSDLETFLKGSTALVTGDTSVQHLAARHGVPMMSLFLGPADVFKTSPYSYNNLVVSASEQLDTNSKTMSVSEITSAFMSWQSGDVGQLNSIAQNSENKYFQIQNLPWRPYFLWQMGEHATMKNYQRALSQLTWQIYLDSREKDFIPPIGTAAIWFSEDYLWDWKNNDLLFAWLNRRAVNLDRHIETIGNLRTEIARGFDPEQKQQEILEKLNFVDKTLDFEVDYFFKYQQCKNRPAENTFRWLNEIRIAISEAEQLAEIEKRLLKQIALEIEQRGIKNVTRIKAVHQARNVEA
jgi:ADP-heptose:LPS heptosyltransferase